MTTPEPADDPSAPSHLVTRLLAGGALLTALLWAVASLDWPFGWDHGVFAWVGDAITRGGAPYRDAWDVKGPAVYYLFAALQSVFGKATWPLRLFDLLLLAAVLVPWARTLRHYGGVPAAWAGALLVVLWYAATGYYHTSQPDGWVAMLMLAVAGWVLDPGRQASRTAWALAGALLALQVLIKPLYGLFLLLPGWLLLDPSLPGRMRVRLATAGLAAFATVLAGTLAWFVAIGAASEFWDAYIRFNLAHNDAGAAFSLRAFLIEVYERLAGHPAAALALPFAAAGGYTLWTRHRHQGMAVLLWLLVALVALGLQSGSYLYRGHILLPPMGFLSGVGIGTLLSASRREQGPLGVAVLALLTVLAGMVALQPARSSFRFLRTAAGFLPAENYERSFPGEFGFTDPGTSRAVGDWLRQRTSPDAVVWTYNDPAAAWWADRRSPSRYAFRVPLRAGPDSAGREARVSRLLADLRSRPPAYISFDERDLLDTLYRGRPNPSRIPALLEFLDSAYVVDTVLEGITIYRRR